MNFSLSPTTIIWCLVIIGVAIAFYIIVKKWQKDQSTLMKHKRIVENFPSIVSTLGVLGTFYGITAGLLGFDTANLDDSIPVLLDGLKTAFFTSLLGMAGSILLSSFINKLFDEKGASDSDAAAARVVNALETMSDTSTKAIKNVENNVSALTNEVKKQANDQTAFHRVVGDNFDQIKQNESALAAVITALAAELQGFSGKVDGLNSALNTLITLQRSQDGSVALIRDGIGSLTASLGNIEESAAAQLAAVSAIAAQTSEVPTIGTHVGEILDITSANATTQEQIAAEVKTFGDKLHGEVVEIEDKMKETNELLEQKFEEFSELLKKSNTEALVEVMKKVTEEFQTQMNALINKLIQENFDQLNKSVERLNTWQQENKEMIASLTRQYQQMATNFEATSTSLTKVKDDTQQLVSDGGKLRQLIDALNKVIIEDEKFIRLTTDLQQTANLTKENMQSFDEATNKLNEWIKKQRDFREGVVQLLAKLEEIAKIKDYADNFWQGTKRNMEESVGIIKSGSQALDNQVKVINASFYERLNRTLGELDNCITKMVEQFGNRR